MPERLWSTLSIENQGELQSMAGEHCDATVAVPGFMPYEADNELPWVASGVTAYPGLPAPEGAGYSIRVISRECGPVAFDEDPVAAIEGEPQQLEERGNLEICADCIAQTCDELIP